MQAHLKSIEELLGKLQVAEESDKDCSALWYIFPPSSVLDRR